MTTILQNDDRDARRLAEVLDEVEGDEALYGHAIEGLSHSIERDIQELENYGLEEHMAKADDDVAAMAAGTLEEDVKEVEGIEQELADDDQEEDKLLAEDEEQPAEELAPEDLQ